MKPKTKLDFRVTGLSALLPEISLAQKEWAQKNIFKAYAAQLRTNIYCLECGHQWKTAMQNWQNEVSGECCPECDTKLEMFQHNGHCTKMDYFSVVTTIQNFQVERVFIVHKHTKKKTACRYAFCEVMQHYISDKGETKMLSLTCNGSSSYYDQWQWGSVLEVRTKNSNNDYLRRNLCKITYPRHKVLPIIKQRGFKGEFHGIKPHVLFYNIIKYNKVETLLKINQIGFLTYACENLSFLENPDYSNAIKTCIKNNYIVKNINDWKDLVSLQIYFGRDIKNPKYVCPENLQQEHNRLVERKRQILRKKDYEKNKREMAVFNKTYQTEKRKYFGLQFQDKELKVSVIKTVQDFYFIGSVLRHCIFTNGYYKDKNNLIFVAEVDGVILETTEFKFKENRIEQSRGLQNKASEYNSRILKLIRENIPLINAAHAKKPAKKAKLVSA